MIDASTDLVDGSRGDDAEPIDASIPVDADPFPMIRAQCLAAGYVESSVTGIHRSVGTNRTWLQAAADCNDDVLGSTHLIVMSSAAEVTFMAVQRGWIGLSDQTTEGAFVTVTGETGDLRPFDSGQPDNGSGSEDCVQMKSNGKLDDDQCDEVHRYVCECDGRAVLP